uniref:Secreted protein n=1 Tax=Callithrix jacchus TaxID=9483 RepID=A0A5F4VUQ2_CALJA
MCHNTWLIFVFLIEMGFYHVGQAGLELLTSNDPPTSASQSAGITESCTKWKTNKQLKVQIITLNENNHRKRRDLIANTRSHISNRRSCVLS